LQSKALEKGYTSKDLFNGYTMKRNVKSTKDIDQSSIGDEEISPKASKSPDIKDVKLSKLIDFKCKSSFMVTPMAIEEDNDEESSDEN
jgi:hypothetical protein